MKKELYLLELSDIFDTQVYLPYSSGVVAAHAFSKDKVKEAYELKEWFYYRQDVDNILSKIENPSILGFSCFVWNWNINLDIARRVKEKHPDCLIVFGGQQQPLADRVGNFFDSHPYVDILVHGEGEETFVEILLEHLNVASDFSTIAGITYFDGIEKSTTLPRTRLPGLDEFESPYLNGMYDRLIDQNLDEMKLDFSAIVESARGCPFQCTFCEIGEKYYQKVRKNYEKIRSEIDWISSRKIEYITDANSNFGMYYEQDKAIALYVKQKKEEIEYPHAYRVTWAKGRADKVLEIAKILEEAKVQKGMTIALQSMDDKVLKAIKRKNVDGGKLKEFVKMYESENISSYVELIWGLPEETLESFKAGVCEVMEMDYHNYLDIHIMTALINTPFSRPEYIEKYGIHITETQPRFHHRHIGNNLSNDTAKFVTSTSTVSTEEWLRGHQFRWIVIFGHYLGPTQFLSRFFREHSDITYMSFYSKLLQFAEDHPESFLGKENTLILDNMSKILLNQRHWGVVLPKISKINWSVDEATAIKVAMNYEIFEAEMRGFLIDYLEVDIEKDLLDDVMLYQKMRMNYPGRNGMKQTFRYNIHEYIESNSSIDTQENFLVFHGSKIKDDYYEWAKKILWHGRRIGDYKTKVNYV